MLATIALSALLMLAVFRVVNALASADRRPVRSQGAGAPLAQLVELLRRDLVVARAVNTSANKIVIVGFGALNNDRLEPSGDSATVTYELEERGGLTWLVRRQSAADVQKPAVQLVWPGVSRLELIQGPTDDRTISESALGKDAAKRAGVPVQVLKANQSRLIVRGDGAPAPLLDTVLQLH